MRGSKTSGSQRLCGWRRDTSPKAAQLNFVENIFDRLGKTLDAPVLQEAREGRLAPVTGREVLRLASCARAFLAKAGLKRGDRCALLAHTSIRWAALDLAAMAEGIIVVPLYARQSPAELVEMMKDCQPSLICCGDTPLQSAVEKAWPKAPPAALLDEIFAENASAGDLNAAPVRLADSDPVTIIYTSGTSGEAKGVVLTVGNINHMLGCTRARLDLLMGPRQEPIYPEPQRRVRGEPVRGESAQGKPDRVFHYLPFCFAGSWILLLTCLSRSSVRSEEHTSELQSPLNLV